MANQLYQGAEPLATTCPNVVDNLTSTSSTDALSAKQGKVLNDKVKTIYQKNTISEPTFTVNALAYVDKSILIPTISGYTPVALAEYMLRTAFGILVKAKISYTDGNYYLEITIGNPTNSAIQPFPEFRILHIKDIS